jgi:hypothetical protein
VSVHQGDPAPDEQAKVRATTLEAVRRLRRWVEGQPRLVSFAQMPEDAYRLEKEGRHAAYIGLGNAFAIGTDLSLIATYYEEGVRCLTFAAWKITPSATRLMTGPTGTIGDSANSTPGRCRMQPSRHAHRPGQLSERSFSDVLI